MTFGYFRPRWEVLLLLTVGLAACTEDETGPSPAGFGVVAQIMVDNSCRNCHNSNNPVYHGLLELTGQRGADSVAVEPFFNWGVPEQSPFVQRLLYGSELEHPVRPFDALSDEDAQAVVRYVRSLAPTAASRELVAISTSAAPVVDGVAEEGWSSAPALTIPIGGGFAGDITVTMRAMYNSSRVYFLVQWSDPTESVVRAPWVRTATGWLRRPVAPTGFDNTSLLNWRNQPADYYYEDKFAIIWNTTGATAVEGFDTNGCAVLCHVGATGDPRPLKYTNRNGEVADMWHWKLVRTNVVRRLDDQYVYWNRSTTVNSGAGRAGDPGGSEYRSNGSTVPLFMSAAQPAPPFFLVDSAAAAAWAAAGQPVDPQHIAVPFQDNFTVGDMVANAITQLLPNVNRSDIEAYGVWSGGTWTLEISRPLTTSWPAATPPGAASAVPVDVQFVPGQLYRFGVAVFDNAQIEHSWSRSVYTLRFQQ